MCIVLKDRNALQSLEELQGPRDRVWVWSLVPPPPVLQPPGLSIMEHGLLDADWPCLAGACCGCAILLSGLGSFVVIRTPKPSVL